MDWQKKYLESIYAISHDLGAPFRHLQGYTALLNEEVEQGDLVLSEEQQQWLTTVGRAGSLGQAMLQGLLQLSRIYRQQVGVQSVELSSIEGMKQATWHGLDKHETLIMTDRRMLEGLLHCLIENATSFGGGAEISAHRSRSQDIQVDVLNLSGVFPASRWEEMLLPFNRLGSLPTPEHTGMGLPLAVAMGELIDAPVSPLPNGVRIQCPSSSQG